MRTSDARPVRLLAFAALLSLLLAACGSEGSPNAAATVNGEEVTIAEVEERYETISANEQFAEQLAADEDGALAEQVQARILTDLIESALVEQGARDLGVEITEEDVEARREQLIEEVGGQEQFDQIVEESGLDAAQITDQIRDLTLREQVQEALTADVEIADADVEEFFEQYRDTRFTTAEARHILVETEDEADEIISRLDDGEDFAELAQSESIDTGSGEQGGDLGEFGRGQMVPEFEEAVFSAEIGEVVGPVESQFGFHIIEVQSRNEPELADVEEEIRAELSQGQEGEAVQNWLTEQRENAEITVNPRFGEWDAERGEVISSAGPLEGPPGGAPPPPPAEGDPGLPPVEDLPADDGEPVDS